MECAECGVRSAAAEQSCARCGAPLPQRQADLSPRSVTGARPMRVRSVVGPVPITPGFYADPGGAGIREWTGTEWSPFLRPAGQSLAGGADPAPAWSPLPPDVQRAQWNLAIKAPAEGILIIALLLGFALMTALCAALAAAVGPEVPAAVAIFALSAAGLLIPAVAAIRNQPARRRIAKAAEKALTASSKEREADA